MYFIAIIPPGNVADEITFFRQDMAKRFDSRAALRVMPHITLKAPFSVPEQEFEKLGEWFKNIPVSVKIFEQELDGFGAFPKSRRPVIFVKPILNPSLQRLQQEVIESYHQAWPGTGIDPHEKDFHPHMTIAYRDLQPAAFRTAWQEYAGKPFNSRFSVTEFHLLKHNGGWRIVQSYCLRI
jgi:2'-5' RNA ligase